MRAESHRAPGAGAPTPLMNLRASAPRTSPARPTLAAIFGPIKGELARVQTELNAHIDAAFALLRDTRHETVVSAGKNLRPAIVLLAGGACGIREPAWFVDLATSGELAHLSTLIHDDVVDEASTRRGHLSINARWENKVAVLVGDYLITQSLFMMARYDNAGLVRTMMECLQEMAQGELFQLLKSRQGGATQDDYYRVIRNKTSSLMAAVCRMPAQLCNAPRETEEALATFGWAFGDAFQIVDDLLDMTQTEQVTGKPAFSDIREGKRTLPVLHMLEVLPGPERTRLEDVLGAHAVNTADRRWLLDRLYSTGADTYALQAARTAADRAASALAPLPDGPYRQALSDLCDFVLTRDK